MKHRLLSVLAAVLLLCGCGQSTPDAGDIEDWLRDTFPDQKLIDWPAAGPETASRFLLHSAAYHGKVYLSAAAMTVEQLLDNAEAVGGDPASLVADADFCPFFTWNEADGIYTLASHEPEWNLFYAVHDIPLANERYCIAEVSYIGYGEYGLYSFDPAGEIVYPEDLAYRTYDDLAAYKREILEHPEEYETVLAAFFMRDGEILYYSGFGE